MKTRSDNHSSEGREPTTRLRLAFDIPGALNARSRAKLARDLREEAVLSLFHRRMCFGGFAATLLGVPLRDFLELLKKRGIPYSRGSKAAAAADQRTMALLDQERKRRQVADEATREALASPELVRQIRKAEKDVRRSRRSKFVHWEDLTRDD